MLGVQLGGVAPTSPEAIDGMKAFNAMVHGWKGQGVDVGHIDQTLNDNLALAPEHHEGATALLAIRLAPDYSATVTPAVATIASNGWSALQAKYIINDPCKDMIVDTGLRRLGGYGYGGWYQG
jgi:hypothetical protein